ncbi:MAG: hypothetical protein KGL77_03635 [Actinomycetales bacterium]|nr:hypothetical protein [Actinomycetales bacterium]
MSRIAFAFRKAATLFVALFLVFANLSPAHAANLSMRIVSLGSGNATNNLGVTFSVEFSNGPASTSLNCQDLIAKIGTDLKVNFDAAGKTSRYTGRDFYVVDIGATSTALTCKFSASIILAEMAFTVESVPLSLALEYAGTPTVSISGKLLNPNFTGSSGISSPSRGQSVAGWVPLAFNVSPGGDRAIDTAYVQICQPSCGTSDYKSARVFPRVDYVQESNDGFVTNGTDHSASVFFEHAGLHEIRVHATFGNAENYTSVLVNVTKDMYSVELPWSEAANLDLVRSPVLNCLDHPLVAGSKRGCLLYFDETTKINTTVPFKIYTSTNNGAEKLIGSVFINTKNSNGFDVPVAANAAGLEIIARVTGGTSNLNAQTYVDSQISLKWPARVKSGQVFAFSVALNNKLSGSCTITYPNGSLLANAKMKSGKASGKTKIVLYPSDARSVNTYLRATCAFGKLELWNTLTIQISK